MAFINSTSPTHQRDQLTILCSINKSSCPAIMCLLRQSKYSLALDNCACLFSVSRPALYTRTWMPLPANLYLPGIRFKENMKDCAESLGIILPFCGASIIVCTKELFLKRSQNVPSQLCYVPQPLRSLPLLVVFSANWVGALSCLTEPANLVDWWISEKRDTAPCEPQLQEHVRRGFNARK